MCARHDTVSRSSVLSFASLMFTVHAVVSCIAIGCIDRAGHANETRTLCAVQRLFREGALTRTTCTNMTHLVRTLRSAALGDIQVASRSRFFVRNESNIWFSATFYSDLNAVVYAMLPDGSFVVRFSNGDVSRSDHKPDGRWIEMRRTEGGVENGVSGSGRDKGEP